MTALQPFSVTGYPESRVLRVPRRALIAVVAIYAAPACWGTFRRICTLDPRLFRYTPSVTITPEHLSRFHAGAATLRLTGFGGSKLLRVPPPRTRTMKVELRDAGRRD